MTRRVAFVGDARGFEVVLDMVEAVCEGVLVGLQRQDG